MMFVWAVINYNMIIVGVIFKMKALSTIKINYKLLNLDVKLYPIRSRADKITFNSLSSCCKHETGLKRYCKSCNNSIEWKQDLKGYKLSKDNFVQLTKAELDTIEKLDNGIEILYFDKLSNISLGEYDKPYFLEPQNNISNKLYAYFNKIFVEQGLIAICRTIVKGTEHKSILRHDKNGIVLHYLENETKLNIEIPAVDLDKEEYETIKEIVKDNIKENEHLNFKNIYIDKVKSLIEQKIAGNEIKIVEKTAEVLNDTKLMDTLKAMKPKENKTEKVIK